MKLFSDNLHRPFFVGLTLCLVFPLLASAEDKNTLKFGLQGQTSLAFPRLFTSKTPKMGLFVNYSLSPKVALQLELDKRKYFADLAGGATFLDRRLRREWSLSLAMQYQMKPVATNLVPFVCIGAGNHYIQDSKAKIRQGKKDPRARGLDYEMRQYFRRAGVFSAVGFKFQANSKAALFIQSKCSILFDKSHFNFNPSSKWTDFINVSTGLKLNLN
ncbi:MAG: hypothetical protein ACE5G1_10210 [bacterium]